VLDGGLRAIERGLEVGRDDCVPIRFGHHHDDHVPGNASIVDENMEVAELLDGELDQCFCLLEVGDVRLEGSGFSAGFFDRLHDFIRSSDDLL
jgi:hypothetical protein